MKNSESPEVLREYATILRRCADENRGIESKTVHLINDILDDLEVYSIDELANQMHRYIKESQNMYMVMEKSASELEARAKCLEEAAPPLFDFISTIDIKAWWEQAYPIIEQIATVTGAITGVAAITATPLAFIKWIRNKLQEKQEKNEYKWIKLILNEDEWNVSVLSQKLELSENETKKILKGFGYMWNAKKMLYIATENTHKLRNIRVDSRTLY